MLKSTTTHYGTVAIAIHWLSALAVILMLISGLMLDSSRDPDTTLGLLRLHVPLGVTVALLTLLRVIWWIFFDRHPASIDGISNAQKQAARLVHLALYGAIIIMVASGIGMVALSGAVPLIIAGSDLPNFALAPPAFVHGLMGRLLLVLAAGHIAAALYHQLVRRDGLIGRMRPGN